MYQFKEQQIKKLEKILFQSLLFDEIEIFDNKQANIYLNYAENNINIIKNVFAECDLKKKDIDYIKKLILERKGGKK